MTHHTVSNPAAARAIEVKPSSAPVPPLSADPTPLFFGAARRSGTTWLAGMLNAHPQIECRNEGWMFNEFSASFPEWLDESKVRAWGARREAQGTWLRHQTIDEAIRVMRRAMWLSLMRQAVEREGWKNWSRLKYAGDKTTTYFCTQVEEIYRTFADARFLHMLRDGRDVVVSDMFLLLRELERRDLPADARREAMAARSHHVLGQGPTVPLFGPAILRHLTAEWARSVAGARRARELFGASASGAKGYYEVRYEQAVIHPAAEIRSIYQWLGVDIDNAFIDELVKTHTFERFARGRRPGQEDRTAEWRKGVSGDWRNHFTNDDKTVFKAMAGQLLVELGYERDLAW